MSRNKVLFMNLFYSYYGTKNLVINDYTKLGDKVGDISPDLQQLWFNLRRHFYFWFSTIPYLKVALI